MRASITNILKLLAYVALAFIVLLIALITTFHIIIRSRAGETGLERTYHAPFIQDFERYAGQYKAVGGNCVGPFFGPVFTYHPLNDSVFAPQDLNKGWALKGHAGPLTDVYVKRVFKAGKLRFIEKRGLNLFLSRVEEDLEIDFSGFPTLTAKDRVRRIECKYLKQ